MTQVTESGTYDEGRPLPYRAPISKSTGGDADDANSGNINKIVIDLGKSVNSVALCAALCGICMATTALLYLHAVDRETATQQREVSTEAQFRKTQNHVDEMTAHVKDLETKLEFYRANK